MQGVVTYMSRVEAFATGFKTESSDQAHFLPIKKLDHGRKHFYRRYISDYPLPWA